MSRTTTNVDTYKLLTDKQLDALNLLVKHKTSKEISRELGISPHTV
ncbi:MAG: LuxR family transcriptional regulator, partial [Betaproteobacteria bacterium]|nr:LuxR family transcriptional regulator [Betaproteobacteria bacterium]